MIRFLFVALIFTVTAFAGVVYAEEIDCTQCHFEKVEGKSVHPALEMGCTICHSGVDATDMPHKFSGSFSKGLEAEGKELCFMCHDESNFSGKANVHYPVDAGMCIECHNPHSSAQEKLLQQSLPELCYNCHDKMGQENPFYGPTVHAPVSMGMCPDCHNPHQSDNPKLTHKTGSDICFSCHDSEKFKGKVVHSPVAAGECLSCHMPHASQNDSLIKRRNNLLCRTCHTEIEKTPHAITGFSSRSGGGHPLRGRRDPKRAGKVFGCLSCHLPHASENNRLFRYKANGVFDLCVYCHDNIM